MGGADAGLEARAWSGHAGLEAELDAYASVLTQAGLDPLCNDPAWCRAHARAFVPSEELFGWTLSEDGRPVAFLPFRVEPTRGRLALARALFSADGTFDSDYLDLAVLPGHEERAIARLLDLLADAPRVQAVVLAGVPDGSRSLGPLRDALAERGLPARERPGDCLAAPLPESFEEYVGGLRSRMRSKLRQAVRQATEAGATLAWCDESASLDRHLAGLFELHRLRWEGSGTEGSFTDERRRAFYHELAGARLADGALRFARLELDGEPLAYQLGIVHAGTYYQLQEGFRPDEERFRAPTALRALAIESLIAEGVGSYDFMAGASRHKRDWGGLERPCTTVAFALPGVRARLSYGLRALLDRRS
jgi:CelD/BcsL family acetyltransferase involved in cellulose biosynthesis